MTQEPAQTERVRKRWDLWAAWWVAGPAITLATAAIMGLAGARHQTLAGAGLSAGLLIGLPALGLARLGPRHAASLPLAATLWSILLMVALPGWFPGELRQATSTGLRWIASPLGEESASQLGAAGGRLVGLLDGSRAAYSAVTPIASEPFAAPEPKPRQAISESTAPEPAAAETVSTVILPYKGEQTSLRVQTGFDGPEIGEQFEMIFDTGATFTTLNHESLDRLGVEVEANAPWITLRTASGEIEAPLVLLDAVWLGDEPVEWVTVAVCDSCANPPSVGLLGLNVTGRFRVSLDHDRQRIELAPRRRGKDSALGIAHWLDVRSEAIRHWEGEVEVTLTATNRAPQGIEQAVVDLSCGTQTFAIQIDDIPAGQDRSTNISLPRGTDCRRQTMKLSRAYWRLDRF